MEENKNLDILNTLENLYNCTKDLSPWSLMFALMALNPGLPETIERLRPYKKEDGTYDMESAIRDIQNELNNLKQ